MHTLSLTLTDGRTFTFEVAKMPRHWKSWLMQQVPYGATFTGCTFNRTTGGN